MRNLLPALIVALLLPVAVQADGALEFCLDGEFDLGARFQGMYPQPGEFTPARWCVITEEGTDRVLFSASGKSNPDMEGAWVVAYLPPDLVRIVNPGATPDVEFQGADSLAEARRIRRVDPRRLIDELRANPGRISAGRLDGHAILRYPGESTPVAIEVEDGRLIHLQTMADLPLRGRVGVDWRWDWADASAPGLVLAVDGTVLFRATGSWRAVASGDSPWRPTPGTEPVAVPGERWPARVAMELVNLTDGVYLVQGVRTGFQHLVIATAAGLIVADAPTGWVELHQVPPVDLVPGLGISGLSEKLIDFLRDAFPGRPIRAVALTHAHDDHAGGARAFAAAGAKVYAPAELAGFLESSLNRISMPADRLLEADRRLRILPVGEPVTLDDPTHPVTLLPMGASPHVAASLGVHVVEQRYFFQSDLHVPRSEAASPREDRLATECWFAAWAVANLPLDTIVINTHSTVHTPVSRLRKYLASELCSGSAFETELPPGLVNDDRGGVRQVQATVAFPHR